MHNIALRNTVVVTIMYATTSVYLTTIDYADVEGVSTNSTQRLCSIKMFYPLPMVISSFVHHFPQQQNMMKNERLKSDLWIMLRIS